MKSRPVGTLRRPLRVLPPSLFAAACLCWFEATAQEVLAPPPIDYSGGAARPRAAIATDQLGPLPPAMAAAAAIANEPPLLQWGPVNLRAHLLYRFLYGDGIPARPGQNFTTVVNEVRPGLLFELGSHWTLDYTPTLRFYSNRQFRDTTDHSVVLNGATTYKDWTLGLSQRYASTSEPLIETGTQTDRENYSTAANATYHVSTKTSLELGLNQNFRFMGQNQAGRPLTDSRDWSTLDWLNYQFWPRFGAALGVGFGYLDFSAGSDMTYEQLQGRINWQATAKVSLVLNAGFDDRQFLSGNTPDLLNPIFGAALLYQPFEPTLLSLNAARTVVPSYFQSQVTESTTLSGSVRQRLLRRLYLDLTGGYRLSSYEATATGQPVNRDISGTFVNVRLNVPFLKRGTASAFFQAAENSSNDSLYKYSTTQVGLELGYRF
ncbi:MAG: hypothetical protein ABSF95_03435 [Verrucomicrobiota bacterium]